MNHLLVGVIFLIPLVYSDAPDFNLIPYEHELLNDQNSLTTETTNKIEMDTENEYRMKTGNDNRIIVKFHPKEHPDLDFTVPELIRIYGYDVETHTVQTDDGYLLSLHRIPKSMNGTKGGQPVFLQHGLLSSSVDWIIANTSSLAFILAEAGYDVWMGNFRGNVYSRTHISLPLDSAAYWNFSWHEMAVYDLPTAITYVSAQTGRPGEILYVGHSMGTTAFFVFASMLPEVAKLVKAMVALAPVAFVTDIRSPLIRLTQHVDKIKNIVNLLGHDEFLPNNFIVKYLSRECNSHHANKKMCENIIFILCGFDQENFDDSLLPVILSHTPAGTSTKTILHYMQEIGNGGKFQHFDNINDNKSKLSLTVPSSYELDKIKVPIYLMYALNDLLASPIDVFLLSNNLMNLIGMYEVPVETFGHLDFLWAKNVTSLVYKPLIEVFEKFKSV